MLKREGTGTTGVPTIPISWWSWRPGMRPGNALLLGLPLTFLALLLLLLGLIALSAGIEDSSSPPLQVPATVITHTSNKATGQSQLMLLLQKTAGVPAKATFTLATERAIPLHASVTVSFSPRLHVAYALRAQCALERELRGVPRRLDIIGHAGGRDQAPDRHDR